MTTLSLRAVNRATLARQHLIERVDWSAEDMITHLLGLQAQAPFPPYTGLWTRLAGFRPEHLADALVDRRVVRIVLMRGTVHLVTAEDAAFLRPLTQVIMDRDLRTNAAHRAALADVDLAKVADLARSILDENALTGRELGAALAEHLPDHPPGSLTHAARGLLPLVQIPPRAVWGQSGSTRYRTAEHWLGRELDPAPDPARLVERYLAAFGPASVADIQAWSGLTRLREVVDPLRPALRTFTDPQGRELFDLPDAPRPDPDLPVPVRFLAEFDNVLLGYADRTRMMTEENRKLLFGRKNGVFPGTVLVDGFLRGEWTITKERNTVALTLFLYDRLTKRDKAALEKEGTRLLEWTHPTAESHEIHHTQ
jgi:hypothetical protein